MEAIGTLAGGIAHDFNNILTSIIGYSEMAKLKVLSDRSTVEYCLDQVLNSGKRAAELVGQILTFGRRTEHEMKVVQIVSIVSEVLTLLRSSLPSTVEIRKDIQIPPEDSTIMADATQIHQVVMNLGTNAGHAMRDKGGMLTVTVKNVEIDNSPSSSPAGLKAGPYVSIIIRDTGHGMSAKVIDRIFDPYFTTKGPGEGSGIGLAVVQGIIKGHGGTITVNSKLCKGAAFQVFLPRVYSPYVPDPKKKDLSLEGGERILFVDDELTLVNLGVEGLGTFGYQVVGKVSSSEAWEMFERRPDLFDLVVTDMTMPGLTGVDLARNVTALRPDIPVILCTGHSDLIKGQRPEDLGVGEIVKKPYQMSDIARVIRRFFDQ
jgi:CheY-like chemotaxis protein